MFNRSINGGRSARDTLRFAAAAQASIPTLSPFVPVSFPVPHSGAAGATAVLPVGERSTQQWLKSKTLPQPGARKKALHSQLLV